MQSLGERKIIFTVPQIHKLGDQSWNSMLAKWSPINKLHGIALQLHILSLLTFSENFVKIRSELFDLDRQTIDKRDATKNTQATTFNNPLSTEAVYISLVYKTPTGGNFGDTIIFLLIRLPSAILLRNYLHKGIATCW